VLAEIGVSYNTPEAIDLLAEAGAQVDRADSRQGARELVERCRDVSLRGAAGRRDPRHDVVVGTVAHLCADGTATYMLDDLTGRRGGSAEC
jgi:trimethylamine:corrinoid methyltransferase-like protein